MEYLGQVPQGLTVLWYKGANEHAKPVPAMVETGYKNGVADLLVMFGDSGIQRVRTVYHMSSKSLRFPETGQLTDNAISHGGWEFCEFNKPEQEAPKAEQKTVKK
jgi:hypothetical protein